MAQDESAQALFDQGFNCSQAVLGACGPELGLDRDTCLKVAAAFGGGMCRSAGSCGAVTGGLMAIGLRYGAITLTDPGRKADVYARGLDFLARFRERHGSTTCRELLGCDISTPEGLHQMKDQDLHGTRCTVFVRDAVAILRDMP